MKDEGSLQLKTALRRITERFKLPIRLTANHNIILYDIDLSHQAEIEEILQDCGVITNPQEIDALTRYSMACPALPTCGLAITESERVLPEIIERIKTVLAKLDMTSEEIVIRMTGCPNGCARPYMAELGFVGSAPDAYQIWLGGSPNQTNLAEPYVQKLPDKDIEKFLEPLFVYFKLEKTEQESFGQFCHRVGFESLKEFSENYKPIKPRRIRKNQHRVSVADEIFVQLKAVSETDKRPMNQIVHEALEAYFSKEKSESIETED